MHTDWLANVFTISLEALAILGVAVTHRLLLKTFRIDKFTSFYTVIT